jgi:LacI family transcriptional regulator
MFNSMSASVDGVRRRATTAGPGLASPRADAPARRRATQLDIARAAGVHNATVSLALRNSPLISAATRRRIQAIAAELGYRPDPALRALVAYRRQHAAKRRIEVLAYVTAHPTRWGWREIAAEDLAFKGAEEKAAELGYRLQHFWLSEPGMTPARLSRVFRSRAIGGVIFADSAGDGLSSGFGWPELAAVKIGRAADGLPLHRVAVDLIQSVRLAIDQAASLGYHRPGLILPGEASAAAQQDLRLAFATRQPRASSAVATGAPFETATDPWRASNVVSLTGGDRDCAEVEAWLKHAQPDVLLGAFEEVSPILHRLGVRVPGDLGFVDLSHDVPPGLAGVRQMHDYVGARSVEILVSQLQQNLRGLPAVVTATLLDGVWRDGASLPARTLSVAV